MLAKEFPTAEDICFMDLLGVVSLLYVLMSKLLVLFSFLSQFFVSAGKTSLITALAGDLRLPIILIPLNDRSMDDRTLMDILSEAPKDSIVLMEDIDCALPKSSGLADEMTMQRMMGREPVTLAGLLNAIDGVCAQVCLLQCKDGCCLYFVFLALIDYFPTTTNRKDAFSS